MSKLNKTKLPKKFRILIKIKTKKYHKIISKSTHLKMIFSNLNHLIILLAIFSTANSLYFTIDHRQRCLYEEVTKQTVNFSLLLKYPSFDSFLKLISN